MSLYDKFASYNAQQEGDVRLKDKFSYLPWASAWEEVLKIDPYATRTINRDPVTNLLYSQIGNTAVVSVTVCITEQGDGNTPARTVCRTEIYPIESRPMRPVTLEELDAAKWNKAVQRATVKCIAMFGLGLNLYRGEDVTEFERDEASDDVTNLVLNANTVEELLQIYSAQSKLIERTPRVKAIFTQRKLQIEQIEQNNNNV